MSQHFWGAAGTDSLLTCQRRSKQPYTIFCFSILNEYRLNFSLGKKKTQRLHSPPGVLDIKRKKKSIARSIYCKGNIYFRFIFSFERKVG